VIKAELTPTRPAC